MRYPMNIGEAAKTAGVAAKMMRHYEAVGLILIQLSGDAAAQRPTAPQPKASQVRGRKAQRTEPRQPECHEHAGLSVWMQSVRHASAVAYA